MAVIMQGALEARLHRVLDEAIELAELGDQYIPSVKIAERLFETEPDLVVDLTRPWVVERLAWLISRRRKERWRAESPAQMALPDPIFKGLPKTIFLRNGQRPRLLHCVLTETEDHLRLLRERLKNHPRVRQFEALVEFHRKWAGVYKGITLSDAMRRESEERGI